MMLSFIIEHISEASLRWEVWEVLPDTTTEKHAHKLTVEARRQYPDKQFRLVLGIAPPQIEQDALF